MTRKQKQERIAETMKFIDQHIMMCDTKEELLVLASAFLAAGKRILVTNAKTEQVRRVLDKVSSTEI